MFGECVRQSVIDDNGTATNSSASSSTGKQLSGGVIAGLAVVGSLIFSALVLLVFGLIKQRAARKAGFDEPKEGRVGVEWVDVSYAVPSARAWLDVLMRRPRNFNDDKVVLDSVSGRVQPGQMMAILGPSGGCFYGLISSKLNPL